jgi:excinuclease UvrABC ATPase subunit
MVGQDTSLQGGLVAACGTPEQVLKNENSFTGRYLKELL